MANSDRRAAVKKLKLLVFSSRCEVEPFRQKIEAAFHSVYIPNRVECRERVFETVVCDELVPDVYASNRIMLYVHGGSFTGGSRASWRSFCASLANESSTRTIVPEIRLAPQFPFPAALEDVQNVFKGIHSEADEIIIAGDGSGASIAMALVLSLKEPFRSKIGAIVLFSPVLDLFPDSPIFFQKKNNDEVMTIDCLKRCGDIYTYSSNLNNYLVSPLEASAAMFEGFPPVYVQMGEKEILLSDAKRLQSKLTDSGSECTLDIWPNMMHMFQMVDNDILESHLAVEKVGKYIQKLGEVVQDGPLEEYPLPEENVRRY